MKDPQTTGYGKHLLFALSEFTEWTVQDQLRHSRFVGLREDKDPSDILPEPESQLGSNTAILIGRSKLRMTRW